MRTLWNKEISIRYNTTAITSRIQSQFNFPKMKTIFVFLLAIFNCHAVINNGVYFLFYGASLTDYVNTTTGSNFGAIGSPYYDSSKPRTVIYWHGYLGSSTADDVMKIMGGYINRGDHNVILCDWSKYAGLTSPGVLGPLLTDVSH